ncbi:hypothetical protein IKX73_00900 [Candidatus Saccharibacteria bacterium]|nr:hypothetical protein [Candidatus Saccharibacteria bacterium]
MSSRRRQKQQERMMRNFVYTVGAAVIAVPLLFLGFSSIIKTGNPCDLYGNRDEISGRSGWCSTRYGYDKVAIVVGNTQNSPVPKLDEKSKEIITDAFFSANPDEDELNLPIISASTGNDLIDLKGEVQAPGSNMTATKNILTSNFSIIEEKIGTAPNKDGADYLNAILKASDLVKGGTKPAIIIIGSGYSDSGKLNFSTDKLLENYTAARKYSKEHDYISSIFNSDTRYYGNELENVDIHWVNLGYVTSPQMPLQEYKQTEENIYNDVFKYLGVSKFETGAGTLLSYSIDTDRTVKTVIPDNVVIKGKTFDINEKVGRFHPDQFILINEQEVKKYLKENIVDNYGGEKLVITGYIAYCVETGSLSTDRANTIKNILISLGIPADKIETKGMPGSPVTDDKKEDDRGGYTCNSVLPDTERRTVRIEVQ